MMRSPIPPAIREQLMDDAYMTCCALGVGVIDDFNCEGRVQWHHAFTYAGKRQNDVWAIIPLCENHHKHEGEWRKSINIILRARIAHFKAESDFRIKYPKSDLL